MDINTGSQPQPGDIFLFDPNAIEIHKEVSESCKRSHDKIAAMAVSLHLHGQRRAVECQKHGDNGLLLVHGFVRFAAARLIRSEFKYTDPVTKEEMEIKNKKFKLWVVISKLD